jgi:TonB family protein
MKSRVLLAWLVVGVVLTISRLAAQDVTVTDPAWLDPEAPPADQLPTFKKRPKPDYPDELKKTEQVAYAMVWELIDENGKILSTDRLFSNPYLEHSTNWAFSADAIKYMPAVRGGRKIKASCWFGVVFNPRSAAPGRENAVPRLLAVAPIVVENQELPAGAKTPLVIWATLRISDKGQLQNFVFDEPAHEVLRPQVGGSLHLWQFAPARQGGLPVAAELHVPLILNLKFSSNLPDTPPKVISRAQPLYPFAMKASGFRGETLVEFTIDRSGSVKDPVVLRSNNPGFNEATIDAIFKWRFQPGLKGGEPVNARMQQAFVFEIDEGGQDYGTVTPASKKAQEGLPEQLRYDIAPKASAVVLPVYPYALLKEKKSGKVTARFLINAEGRVAAVKILEASSPEFGLALEAALEAHEFIPAMKGGKPTASVLKMEREFSPYGGLVSERDSGLLRLEKKHPEKILSGKILDAPLKPIFRRKPRFPSSVADRLDHGETTIEILIDEEGKVGLPRIVEATDPAFGYAAVQAIADWRFEPPMAAGKPAIVRVQVPFNFVLEPAVAKSEIPPAAPQTHTTDTKPEATNP